MINGHSVTFDVENPDASDPHHAPFDEALVEKILNGATVPNAPAMLDMAANTDTFDFDVPYGNKWVDKGYIDVGYEYHASETHGQTLRRPPTARRAAMSHHIRSYRRHG